MSEPISSDDPEVGAPERLHPLFLLTALGGSIRGMAGGYAFIAYLAVSGRAGTAVLLAIALLAIIAIATAIYWTRFSFRVSESEIRIDSGVISRRHRSIPYGRIQDVDVVQGPLARLLGIAQVKFETGGSGGEDEGVLPAIPLRRATEIRTLIRARRSADGAIPIPAQEPDRAPVYAMNIRRLLLAGTFNFSLAVFAGLFGISQTLGDALGFDPLSRRFWLGVLSADSALGRYVLEHRASTAIAGALLLIIVGLATGIIRTTVRDFGFRLQRTDAGLRRRRGLLTRTDVTLPVSRAQAIVLRSGPVRAWFGWTKVTVQSLARDDGGGSDHVLAPLATGSEAATITSELGWRPVPSDVEWTRVSRAYVWMRVIAVAPLVPIALAQVLVDVRLGAGLVALLLAAIGGRWLARRRTAYGVDGDRLLIRSGWWQRRLVLLPKAKIQSIDVYETFVSRWFGTATLQLGTAGSGAGGHSIPAIPSGTARTLRRQLLGSSA